MFCVFVVIWLLLLIDIIFVWFVVYFNNLFWLDGFIIIFKLYVLLILSVLMLFGILIDFIVVFDEVGFVIKFFCYFLLCF